MALPVIVVTSDPAPRITVGTDTAKVYTNYAQGYGPRWGGHRTAQFLGRQIQVVSDDATRDHTAVPAYITMLKHPQ